MPTQIINFYDHVEKKLRDEEITYDNEKELRIKLTFRMMLIGSTGSGKTNTCLNLVKQINAWDRILLFAKNVEEPLWAQFIKNFRDAEKQSHTEILTVDTDISHLPAVDKWDKKSHVLLILDDMMSENPKLINSHVIPWFTRGRKKNASCIWLGQSYYEGTPLKVRQNTDYIVLNKVLSNNDLYRILSEYPLDVSKDEIVRLYHAATKGGYPNFFLIDLKAGYGKTPIEYRYRRNFDPLPYKTLSGSKETEGDDGKDDKKTLRPSKRQRTADEKKEEKEEGKEGKRKEGREEEEGGEEPGQVARHGACVCHAHPQKAAVPERAGGHQARPGHRAGARPRPAGRVQGMVRRAAGG